MEQTMTLMTVGAGMLFSISIALLLEELVFGGLFRLFFGRKPQPVAEEAETARSRR